VVHPWLRGDAEIFIVHCEETQRIYAVPVDEAPASHGYLRVDPAQQDGIRWACDYELPA
jgi:PD-(D/E)XK nuclease superfamily protein